jgi:hypothetical protein
MNEGYCWIFRYQPFGFHELFLRPSADADAQIFEYQTWMTPNLLNSHDLLIWNHIHASPVFSSSQTWFLPKSRTTGRFLQENTRNQWNLEAVFRPESLLIFPGDFRLAFRSFRQETPGNDREKNPKIFRPEYCFHFRRVLEFSCRFRSFPETGIIDLG